MVSLFGFLVSKIVGAMKKPEEESQLPPTSNCTSGSALARWMKPLILSNDLFHRINRFNAGAGNWQQTFGR
jgi:hypothetical protein